MSPVICTRPGSALVSSGALRSFHPSSLIQSLIHRESWPIYVHVQYYETVLEIIAKNVNIMICNIIIMNKYKCTHV